MSFGWIPDEFWIDFELVLKGFWLSSEWILHELSRIFCQAVRVLCWDNFFFYTDVRVELHTVYIKCKFIAYTMYADTHTFVSCSIANIEVRDYPHGIFGPWV